MSGRSWDIMGKVEKGSSALSKFIVNADLLVLASG
jgi:hypothetical protein